MVKTGLPPLLLACKTRRHAARARRPPVSRRACATTAVPEPRQARAGLRDAPSVMEPKHQLARHAPWPRGQNAIRPRNALSRRGSARSSASGRKLPADPSINPEQLAVGDSAGPQRDEAPNEGVRRGRTPWAGHPHQQYRLQQHDQQPREYDPCRDAGRQSEGL